MFSPSFQLIQESNDSITQMKSIESLVSLSAKVDFECRVRKSFCVGLAPYILGVLVENVNKNDENIVRFFMHYSLSHCLSLSLSASLSVFLSLSLSQTLPLVSQSRRLVREGPATELMDFSLKETERSVFLHLFNDYLLLSLHKE